MKEVIIIKKKGRGAHAAHHGGAWKVALADFMTAMMCFFLVMWLVSQKETTRSAIAAYFRDPGVFATTSAGGLTNAGPGVLEGAGGVAYAALVEETNRQRLQKTAERIEEEIAKAVGLKGLEKQVDVQVTGEGLRIELQDSDNSMFFDSGSARVHPEGERVLALIATELDRLARPVVVEGHTDSRPYGGAADYSNWDLSADRANAARRVMESGGLSPALISAVRGFADRRPRILNDPMDARNRRVSIVVPLDTRKPEGR